MSLREVFLRVSHASSWFERTRSGRLDARADEELSRWIQAEPRNAEALELREFVWNVSDELRGREVFEAMLREADAQGRSGQREARWAIARLPVRYGLAAGFAATMLVMAMVWAGLQWRQPEGIEYVTAAGEQRTVTLPDQSTVTLNTDTRLVATVSDRVRRIDLARGEALFTVAHDVDAPFEVHSLGGFARAVGTQFNVYLRESAEISVLEGTVDTITRPGDGPVRTTRLVAGQSIQYDAAGGQSAIQDVDRNRILGWQRQRIVLRNMTVVDAIAEYGRYGGTQFVLQAERIGDRRVSGNFRIGDEEAFVGALERALPLRAERTDGQIVLRMREE